MLESGTELIDLVAGESYMPTKTSVDKRNARQLNTSLAYWQIGANAQQGISFGPVFKIEFVDLSSLPGPATHVKIWGVQNETDTAPLWPISYFALTANTNKVIGIWLNKFEFTDSDGVVQEVDEEDYSVIGYKKRVYPMVW